jgi:hypothetical protein
LIDPLKRKKRLNYEEAPYAERNPSQASRRKSVSAKLRISFAGLSKQQVITNVEKFCRELGFEGYLDDFKKGALKHRFRTRTKPLSTMTSCPKKIMKF